MELERLEKESLKEMTGTRTSILTETLHRHWCLCMCEPWVSEDPSYCLSIASYAFTYVNKFPHSLKNKKTIRHFSFPHFLHLAYHPTKKDKTYLEDPIYRALFCRSIFLKYCTAHTYSDIQRCSYTATSLAISLLTSISVA